MRIVGLSDTHKQHKEVHVPDGDVIVFAGDMCGGGGEKSARRFVEWFSNLSHSHKIVVAGNHDRCLDNSARVMVKDYFYEKGLIYLEHEPYEIEGIKFFGSPYTPIFGHWSFTLKRGEELARQWRQIPDDTNVLITHGPVYGIRDQSGFSSEHCGCRDLGDRVSELSELKLHIFGHIHDGYGVSHINGKTFANVCICNEEYEPVNKPIIFDL